MRAKIEEIPKITRNFAKPARTRVFRGGRGSGKTRGLALRSALRIYQLAELGVEGVFLASREHLNSLDESSMEEIKAAIRSIDWLATYFDIGEKYIRTKNRRISYAFAGLRHNLDSIKSKARIIGNWTDEAEGVSEVAWRKLVNTLREEGDGWHAENWISYNPESDKSATHKRFVESSPDDCIVTTVNWSDNPWFPDILNASRLEDQRLRPDTYEHVWNGAFLTRTKAQVFTNWRIAEFKTPADAVRRFGADWGFAQDPTTLVSAFTGRWGPNGEVISDVSGRVLFVDEEAYAVGCEIDDTPALFAGDCPVAHTDGMERWTNPNKRKGVSGALKWRITADSARPETIRYMRRRGFKILPAIKGAGSIEDGVEFLKSFEIVVHKRCVNTAEEMKTYSFKVDPVTEEVLPILADKNNHVIDALRYAHEGVRRAKAPAAAVPKTNPPDLWGRKREDGDSWKTA